MNGCYEIEEEVLAKNDFEELLEIEKLKKRFSYLF